MRKTIRRGAAALLAAIVLTGSLSGCSVLKNTRVVLTTGLSGDQLFKIGKSVITNDVTQIQDFTSSSMRMPMAWKCGSMISAA